MALYQHVHADHCITLKNTSEYRLLSRYSHLLLWNCCFAWCGNTQSRRAMHCHAIGHMLFIYTKNQTTTSKLNAISLPDRPATKKSNIFTLPVHMDNALKTRQRCQQIENQSKSTINRAKDANKPNHSPKSTNNRPKDANKPNHSPTNQTTRQKRFERKLKKRPAILHCPNLDKITFYLILVLQPLPLSHHGFSNQTNDRAHHFRYLRTLQQKRLHAAWLALRHLVFESLHKITNHLLQPTVSAFPSLGHFH